MWHKKPTSYDTHSLVPKITFPANPNKWEMGSAQSLSTKTKKEMRQMAKPTVVKTAASYLDGWAIRERFLRLPHTEAAALDFLHDVGLWETAEQLSSQHAIDTFGVGAVHGVFGERFLSQAAIPVELDAFWRQQENFRKTLENPIVWKMILTPTESKSEVVVKGLALFNTFSTLPFRVEWKKDRPIGVIETISGLELIHATLNIDLIRGAKFRTCARPDCGMPFAVTSNHDRKYCDWYCGHIESVRRQREKERRQRKDGRDGTRKRT